MYGKNKYGLLQYARDSTPGSVQTDYYIELSQYVPQFIANITEIKEIYSTEGYELGILQNVFEDIFHRDLSVQQHGDCSAGKRFLVLPQICP